MTRYRNLNNQEHGVSPVVGVMLMLVVTIIIAAVVSAYAGGITGSQKKIPQATIKGEFSISDGLMISHAGGDPIPMSDLVMTIWDGPTFGVDVEQVSKQVLDMKKMTDSSGKAVLTNDGLYNLTSFNPGTTLTIKSDDCNCDVLQPNVAPTDYTNDMGSVYTGMNPRQFGLCIKNQDNIGKRFVLTISDKNGNLIGRTDVSVEG